MAETATNAHRSRLHFIGGGHLDVTESLAQVRKLAEASPSALMGPSFHVNGGDGGGSRRQVLVNVATVTHVSMLD